MACRELRCQNLTCIRPDAQSQCLDLHTFVNRMVLSAAHLDNAPTVSMFRLFSAPHTTSWNCSNPQTPEVRLFRRFSRMVTSLERAWSASNGPLLFQVCEVTKLRDSLAVFQGPIHMPPLAVPPMASGLGPKPYPKSVENSSIT
jgi:hypothetical protein